MNEPSCPSDEILSPTLARQVDRICDRFEAAWKAGPRPDVGEYLAAATGPVRSALLRQLLLLDWDYRRRAGDDRPGGLERESTGSPTERNLIPW